MLLLMRAWHPELEMDERAALRDGGRNNPSLQPGWRMMEGNQWKP